MSAETYDVAIIGGGIVGCSVLFELCQQGYSCILCEAQPHIISGASAGNSGMLHTGFDAPLESLELQCIQWCQAKIFDTLQKFHIPFQKCGAHVVAWTAEEEKKLPSLLHHSNLAEINSAAIVSASDIYKAEPALCKGALGALFVPEEAIVDSNLLGVCFAHHAKKQGSKVVTNCAVEGFKEGTLITCQGPVKAKVAINCAGLHGDSVDLLAGVQSFEIKPRKGQYCVFARNSKHLLNSMLFPVPTERTKGVVLFRSVYDNILMGPTAEDTKSRIIPAPDKHMHQVLSQQACALLPGLVPVPVVGSYVGVRPATQWKDYQIQTYPEIGWLTVGGIRSTGVSGSLGIAKYVIERLQSDMGLEPSGGRSSSLQEMHWQAKVDGASVVIDGCSYHMSHPIFQFGHQNKHSML